MQQFNPFEMKTIWMSVYPTCAVVSLEHMSSGSGHFPEVSTMVFVTWKIGYEYFGKVEFQQ